jgi:ABC-type glycerol-3-phosphate transport system substrate-binding protein
MPSTIDFVARVDRARDLQVSRGEALRDGVEVEVVPTGIGKLAHELPDEDRLEAVRRSLAAGERADVIWTPLVDLGDLSRDRHIVPIGAFVARDHVDLKAYGPQALQPAFAPDRGLMALPDAIAARQVYFRPDHLADAGIDFRRAGLDFEKPKITWDAIRRVALDAHASAVGKSRFSFDPLNEAFPAAAWAWQAGLPIGRPLEQHVHFLADTLNWLRSLAKELNLKPTRRAPNQGTAVRYGTVGPFPEGTAISLDDGSRHPLLNGTSTIVIDSTRLVSTVASFDASTPFRVVELPRRNAQARAVGWVEVSGYALGAGATDDGWDLLKYLTGEDAAYASARAVAMRLPPIARASAQARAPEDLLGGPRWWFPPYSGRSALDRFLAKQYRTGVKVLDEAHDHGMEQIRAGGIIPFGPGTRGWLAALEVARRAVLQEGTDPIDAARGAILTR